MSALIKPVAVVWVVGVVYASAWLWRVEMCSATGRGASAAGATEQQGGHDAERKDAPVVATIVDEPVLRFPEAGVARVAFEKGINHVLVTVTDANGGGHTFFIDTGASFSVVTPRFLEAVEAPVRGGLPAGAAYGAQGALPGTPELRELRDLRVGDLVIERAGAVALGLPDALEEKLGRKIHGIIGYNILSRLVTLIDYPAGQVAFVDASRPDAVESLGKPEHVVPFRLRLGALIEVTGSINGGAPLPFLVDVGSRYTILNRPASHSSGITFEALGDDKLALGCGAGPGVPVERGRADGLRFGSLNYEGPELYAIDLPVFATLGLADREAGIWGNDLLGQYRVAIDYGRGELRFWWP